ncbi:MAG: recombinase family protein [Pseudonocardiaceae bacterium]
MFERFGGGYCLGEIMRDLNRRGIRTSRRHEWITNSVKQVLMNPRYAGLRGVRRVHLDERGRTVTTASGNHRRERW